MEGTKHERVIIIGTNGHEKVVDDIVKPSSYKEIVFLDDGEIVKEYSGWPVIGKSNEASEGELFVTI